MKRKEKHIENRRSIITGGLGLAAVGVGATVAMRAQAQRPQGFMPARHELDSWMDELGGQHRIFIDSASSGGGGDAMLYASNLYNAHRSAYSGSDGDLAIIVCFRHFSTPFGYTDAVWEKYGEQFGTLMQLPAPSAGSAPTANPMNSTESTGGPPAVTIASLVARGTHFAICATATRFVADQVANTTGSSADEVFDELMASAIPNGRFVPAGVMALTRSQEYGYSLLCAG